MSATAIRFSVLDTFRSVWVCGRLDYQRAAEALDAARQAAAEIRAVATASPHGEELLLADERVEGARQHLAEIGAALEEQFDRFCGLDR